MAIKDFNVGIKAAIIQDEKLLVMKHAAKGYWDLPGGRIDDDETVMQTLARELGEELPGIEVHTVGSVITVFRVPNVEFENGSGLVLVVYKVTVEFDVGDIALSDEHSELRWVTFEEALELGSHVVTETITSLRQA